MTARHRLITAGSFFLLASGLVLTAACRGSDESPAQLSSTSAEGGGPAPPVRVEQIKPRTPTGMTADEAIAAHLAAVDGPQQPIPFNHRFHSQELRMQCEYCHVGTESSPVAVIPSLEVCMGCHRIAGANLEPIQRLRGFWDSGEPVPWERVYKVPDFVQFPHEAHIRTQVACEECHGKVEEMDRVYKFTSLKMGWCLDCHWGPGEDTDVATDRLLIERFPPPETPDERQPVGLYPRRLDQEYGKNRGPIDCTACHY
jgi:hypothetical protein